MATLTIENTNITTEVVEQLLNNANLQKNQIDFIKLPYDQSNISVDAHAFEDFSSLTAVQGDYNVTHINAGAFENCVSLTAFNCLTCKKIENNAFKNCVELQHIGIGGSITNIGDYAFYGCSKLSGFSAASLMHVGMHAFEGCTNLSTINAKSLREVGEYSFKDCTAMSSISFDKTYRNVNVEQGAFENCTSMVRVGYGVNVRTFGKSSFKNCINLSECSMLSANFIEDNAFEGCTSITYANTKRCTTIGQEAFKGCTSLTAVNAAECKFIDANAFQNTLLWNIN